MLKPCEVCRRPGRFYIAHYPDGVNVESTAVVCSLACLAIWGWHYGKQLSKRTFQRLLGGKSGAPR